MKQEKQAIPDGYWLDARGCLIPESLIKEIDKTRDTLVNQLIDEAIILQGTLAEFRQNALSAIGDFVALSAKQYKVKLGGEKGNVTLYSFDGRFKLQVAKAEKLVFDERLQAAKALIDECIDDWTDGTRPEIRVLINDAFKVDKEGNLSSGRVLGLKRLKIDDKRWKRAMEAIAESVQVIGSKSYIRFYVRDDRGEYQPISLDVAKS